MVYRAVEPRVEKCVLVVGNWAPGMMQSLSGLVSGRSWMQTSYCRLMLETILKIVVVVVVVVVRGVGL